MNSKALRFVVSIALAASLVMGVCACNRNAEPVSTDSYWYGCSSFRVPAVEGYRQGMRSSIYSDGYYYLAVYGEKSDEKTDGPEEYYRLYKIDSDGNEVSNVSLPVKCAHSGNQGNPCSPAGLPARPSGNGRSRFGTLKNVSLRALNLYRH